jgi:signal transduction histidine kinase
VCTPAKVSFVEPIPVDLANLVFRKSPVPPRPDPDWDGPEPGYRALVEQLPVIVFTVDLERGLGEVYASPPVEKDWLTDPVRWHDQIHPDDRKRLSLEYDALRTAGEPLRTAYRVLAHDGNVTWFHCNATMARREDGRPWRLDGLAYMIGAGIERAIVEISAREQRRIGQDLHDRLGQLLTGIAFLGKVHQEKLAAKSLPEVHDAARIVALVNEAIHKTGELARGLLPVLSEAHGLPAALQQRAVAVEDLYQVSCRFECSDPIAIADENVAVHLYHIAQEAVQNAIKHGQAKHIVVGLGGADGRCALTIEDDGLGFPEIPENHSGLGLRIMSYRAKIIGGSLDVRGRSGGGASITCLFPGSQ